MVGRKRIRRLMTRMDLAPIYQRPRTTVPNPEHRIFPYLRQDLAIDRPHQVWCADITDLPMRSGFPGQPVHLAAVHRLASASWRNAFIERLWRSLKDECVYLHAFEAGSELRAGLSKWIGCYNAGRPHSALAGRTSDAAYAANDVEKLAA